MLTITLAAFLATSGNAYSDNLGTTVESMRIWDHTTHTRVVIDMDDAADFVADVHNSTLMVKFPSVKWRASTAKPSGIIKKAEFLSVGQGGKLTIRTNNNAKIVDHFYLPPDSYGGHRIVFDITTEPVNDHHTAGQQIDTPAISPVPITDETPTLIEVAAIDTELSTPHANTIKIPFPDLEIAQRSLPEEPTKSEDDLELGRQFVNRTSNRRAVSGLNGKFATYGGSVDDISGDFAAVTGSITGPLGDNFGLQVDGMLGELNTNLIGAGGHIFWRDPDNGMAGLTGSWIQYENVADENLYRTGVEAEAYLGPVTFAVTGGHQGGVVQNTFYGGLEVRGYWAENFMTKAGYLGFSNSRLWDLGGEVNLGRGISIFANGTMSSDQFDYVIGGLRVYIGEQRKSLIARHREDGTTNPIVPDTLALLRARIE